LTYRVSRNIERFPQGEPDLGVGLLSITPQHWIL
jgi:hypothetical protein